MILLPRRLERALFGHSPERRTGVSARVNAYVLGGMAVQVVGVLDASCGPTAVPPSTSSSPRPSAGVLDHGSVAQLAEQAAFNGEVAGSTPARAIHLVNDDAPPNGLQAGRHLPQRSLVNDSTPVAPVGDPEPGPAVKTAAANTTPDVALTPAMTSYVLLSMSGRNQWLVESVKEARSAEAAIRAYFTGLDAEGQSVEQTDEPMTIVAVPERSWKPVTVKPKTTTTLVIEEAS